MMRFEGRCLTDGFVSFLVTLPDGSMFVHAWDTVLHETMPDEMFSYLRTKVDIELALAIEE
jgi:hypothetical protein